MTRLRRTTRLAATGGTLLVLLVGCGSDSPPSTAVPTLSTRLDEVDAALVDGRDAAARDALGALGEETVAALEDGDLDQAQAERILDAVQVLLEALPSPTPAEEPTQETTPEVDADDDEDSGDPGDDDEPEETKDPKPPKGEKGPRDKGDKDR